MLLHPLFPSVPSTTVALGRLLRMECGSQAGKGLLALQDRIFSMEFDFKKSIPADSWQFLLSLSMVVTLAGRPSFTVQVRAVAFTMVFFPPSHMYRVIFFSEK